MDISKLKRATELKGKITEFFTLEEINAMANDYAMPHYILHNPVKKEDIVLYDPVEVNEWLRMNFIKRNECRTQYDLTFIHFDYNAHKVIKTDIVPAELSLIRDLYKIPKEILTAPPGIYFLCKDNQIVYIGQSVNVPVRISNHISEGMKDFDSCFFIPCHISSLLTIEQALMRFFRPKYNIQQLSSPTPTDVALVEEICNISKIGVAV